MIGLLNAYHWDKNPNSYQAKYAPMCVDFLKKAFPDQAIKVYELPTGEKPALPTECDMWLISGSGKSAYENIDWINELKVFIQDCHKEKSKLIGLCFGHQMIAAALGGAVKKSAKGWGVGVRSFDVLCEKPWMSPALKQVSLLYSHQDQVSKLPDEAEHLGQSEFCTYEAFQIGNHILAFQGHPEFTKDFALDRYQSRKELLGEEVYAQAVQSLQKDSSHSFVWNWIKSF